MVKVDYIKEKEKPMNPEEFIEQSKRLKKLKNWLEKDEAIPGWLKEKIWKAALKDFFQREGE